MWGPRLSLWTAWAVVQLLLVVHVPVTGTCRSDGWLAPVHQQAKKCTIGMPVFGPERVVGPRDAHAARPHLTSQTHPFWQLVGWLTSVCRSAVKRAHGRRRTRILPRPPLPPLQGPTLAYLALCDNGTMCREHPAGDCAKPQGDRELWAALGTTQWQGALPTLGNHRPGVSVCVRVAWHTRTSTDRQDGTAHRAVAETNGTRT